MSDNNKPPIVKQLLGAGVGATIALALYAGYQVAAPNVLAYINVHRASQDEARFSSRSLDEEDRQMERQQQRNREIARAHDAPVIQGSNASDVFDTIAERVKEIEEDLVQEETKEAEEAYGTEEITEEIIEVNGLANFPLCPVKKPQKLLKKLVMNLIIKPAVT